ncbi:hypothetical protein BJF93_08030 [Xaviernesmea oryzae]|uniref:Uncharacterized protein n=1 Tax=Xaviernesmea oryzae TaxID=464029 RepID=A0A1Q9AWA2_9HYPH|nr:hypothetical protein [Xaviernesmea oryzae]OLP59708.1 hypothetical protein BJF93_08030 [Xaviernesmea oryzae]SEM35733.1 Type II secretory pathway, component PulK [Xaviernesmea oryzae]
MRRLRHPDDRGRDEAGFALIVVLGFLLLMSFILIPFASISRYNLLLAQNKLNTARLMSVADTLNQYLASKLRADPLERLRMTQIGMLKEDCAIGDVMISITIVPHNRLINVNIAQEPLLVSGLEQLGFGALEADTIAQSIVEFRSPSVSSSPTTHDVENGMKHAPFEELVELHDLPALRSVSLRRLSYVFSVYDGRSVDVPIPVNALPSSVYGVETSVFGVRGRVERYSVYALSEGSDLRRVAEIDDPILPEPRPSTRECSMFEPNLLQLVVEIV